MKLTAKIMGMALGGVMLTVAPAEAAIFVNFSFTGDSAGTTNGTVKGVIGFDAAGTSVKAISVRVVSSTNKDLDGDFVFPIQSNYPNSFDVSEQGLITKADLYMVSDVGGDYRTITLNEESANRYQLGGKFGGEALSITNFGGFSGATYMPYEAAAAVPEPATWAMMIGGFGLIGATMRRRNKIATAVKFA